MSGVLVSINEGPDETRKQLDQVLVVAGSDSAGQLETRAQDTRRASDCTVERQQI
jgi:hypothetical protein